MWNAYDHTSNRRVLFCNRSKSRYLREHQPLRRWMTWKTMMRTNYARDPEGNESNEDTSKKSQENCSHAVRVRSRKIIVRTHSVQECSQILRYRMHASTQIRGSHFSWSTSTKENHSKLKEQNTKTNETINGSTMLCISVNTLKVQYINVFKGYYSIMFI